MKHKFLSAFLICLSVTAITCRGNGELNVKFNQNGLEKLSYNGVLLEDVDADPSDAFHIWHMKATDLHGNVLTSGQYGWGENNNGRAWDAASQTWKYSFIWGSINVQFVQVGPHLDMNVTVKNLPESGIIFQGATIYPMVLHFPQLPAGFGDHSFAQLAFNTTGPSVTPADFGSGEVVAVGGNTLNPLYSGFVPISGSGSAYVPIMSGTALDNLATFQPHFERPLAPGQTDTFTVSLRFAPSHASVAALAGDVFHTWSQAWPEQLHWSDHRIIGTIYLATSPQGSPSQSGGYPNNPRRYFNNADPSRFDVRTLDGLGKFQARVLKQASDAVHNLKQLNAQGMITWDLEGEQYPQRTSYVCAPDAITQIAPEMESAISDMSSPYKEMKLDDAYFKIFRDAGFRAGLCLRPQHFTLNGDGTASQQYLPGSEVANELMRKARYAHDRWGVTLFYVDSSVDQYGGALDAAIFQQLASALPDSLFLPEEYTPKHYAYSAPFQSFLFHGDTGTPSIVYDYYPHAFSTNLINDVDPAKLSAARVQLTNAVRHGDILMVHADYWQVNNPVVMQIYKAAQ